MDNNIFYLYEKVLKLNTSNEFDFSIFKTFLSLYSEKAYLRDIQFLKHLDLLKMNTLKSPRNMSFDYKKYINFLIPDNAQKIIFFNGFYSFSENLSSDILFKYNKFSYDIFLHKLKKFYLDFVYNRLNFFYILNSIFFSDGIYISIPDNIVLDRPLYVLNFFDSSNINEMVHPRLFLFVGKNANINIMDGYFNFSKNLFVNISSCLLLDQSSFVNYYFVNENATSYLNSYSFFSGQYKNSNLKFNDLSFGENYYKGNYNFILNEDNCSLNKYVCKHAKKQSLNNIDSNVFHLGSKSKSNINYCVLGNDNSSSFFTGGINVDINIDKVDANLKCDGLLLSDLSHITLVPELYIKSNDVKCSHGATVGYIDKDILFYMKCRGIVKLECIKIIIDVFLSRCIDKKNLFFHVLNKKIINEYFTFDYEQ